MMKRFLVMIGPPGGGKGTQAQILSKRAGLPHVSTGELFRVAVREGTDAGRKVKEMMDSGALVPDDLTLALIGDKLAGPSYRGGFIFDGFPRTLDQAEGFDKMLASLGIAVDAALYIKVPDEYIVGRVVGRFTCARCNASYHDSLKPTKVAGVCDVCGGTQFLRRVDDTAETVGRRLAQFRDSTLPVVPYYEKRGVLAEIDGVGSVDEVAARVAAALGE